MSATVCRALVTTVSFTTGGGHGHKRVGEKVEAVHPLGAQGHRCVGAGAIGRHHRLLQDGQPGGSQCCSVSLT
jgi:hypothetical protein